ncbi:MAG: hypothetical protein QOI82_2730 [Actinomycetota bacterium]|jgi:uncharacterized membrane protein|nr:hypothetical protein [Actinomycetota bacterium]
MGHDRRVTVVSLPPAAATSELVLPSSDDPVVAGAVTAVGGPPGTHARLGARRFWTPVRVIVVLTLLTCTLGFLQKAPCRTEGWAHGYQYTRLCYTDVFALYGAEGLAQDKRPYLDHPVEYPVLMGAAMEVVAKAVRPFDEADRNKRFYDLTWALLTGCAVVVAITTARLAGRRPWDAALFALAPGLALHGTTNWDLIAMALAGVGLLAWARRRPAMAGVFLGLATAAKLYPILFLIPLALLCFRSGRFKAFAIAAATTVIAFLAVTAPVYAVSPYFYADPSNGTITQVATSPLDRIGHDGLSAFSPKVIATLSDGRTVPGVNSVYRFFDLNTTRPADWDSLWFVLQTERGVPLDANLPPNQAPHHLNLAVALSFIFLLIGIALLALRAPRRPRLPQLLFLVLVAFLVTNKVFSPQYAIWLLPLAVLARPRWKPFLLWQAAEILVLFTRFYYFLQLDNSGHGIPIAWFLAAVMLRDAVLLGYAALVVRDILRPELDVVRNTAGDDPAGGVLDGADDWLGSPAVPVPA